MSANNISNGWVDVKDKLPHLEVGVIVINVDGDIAKAELLFEPDFIFDDNYDVIGLTDPEYSWYSEMQSYDCETITHWMEIPPI